MHHAVAVGHPAFALRALPLEVVVVAPPPDGVGREHPERRRPRPRGEVDEDVPAHGAQGLDERDGRVEVLRLRLRLPGRFCLKSY